ncbi:MAG: nucleotidyltransferase domain-containing protein [Methylococcales symbiont of Iophon sp. n. MRB-2018]|nr:MAG: nucleotidyltransferase domain-containing protein [Methylococcales symbiont of Iophon sp. n. MRB-2018]KAF3980545.1 MAG: nucleotidyltransferase domain-containing protein [Methylococcales symbiont of Iophon sp. n. MRB-2018]
MNTNLILDLKPVELKQVEEILRQCIPEKKVYAFGSRTNGTAKPYSDLDLAIITKPELSLKQSAILTEKFEESDLPFRVDILDWATTSAKFKQSVKSSLIAICRQHG